jgi:hypothetical protein
MDGTITADILSEVTTGDLGIETSVKRNSNRGKSYVADEREVETDRRIRNRNTSDKFLRLLRKLHPEKVEAHWPVPEPVRTQPKKVEPVVEVIEEECVVESLEAQIEEIHPISLRLIQGVVCRHFGMRYMDLVSQRRTAEIVWPRQIAMWLCKAMTMRSLPEIAKQFGGKDHTTVLHAVQKVERMSKEQESFLATLDELREHVRTEAAKALEKAESTAESAPVNSL